MRTPDTLRALACALACLLAVGTAQAQTHDVSGAQTGATDTHTSRRAPMAIKGRLVVQAGTGLTTSAFVGSRQDRPSLQVTGLFRVAERLAVGLTYAAASSTAKPYVDDEGVQSFETTAQRHLGVRLSGDIVDRGSFALYGGLQIGVTSATQRYRHVFPEGMVVESEALYLASRPSPFYPEPSQVTAVGFLGVTARVLPRVHVYAEIGNSLALVSAGAQVRLR